jgi:flagellar basal body rod protein FlgG
MDALSVAAASGIRSRIEALDLLANNLANAGSAGYKADRDLNTLYLGPDALAGDGVNVVPTLPVINDAWIDFGQGATNQTGQQTDFAITGRGFFAVQAPGGVLYTRNGSFSLGSSGQLQTKEGYAVLGRNGKPVQIDPSRSFEVDRRGVVRQGGRTLGELNIIDFDSMDPLRKQGATYFRLAQNNLSGKPAGKVEVLQGRLEAANASPVESAVRLVSVMRGFEMLQRALTLAGEMNRKAVDEVGSLRS